jgi:sodium/potassium-transporting ATPase subunit alpha
MEALLLPQHTSSTRCSFTSSPSRKRSPRFAVLLAGTAMMAGEAQALVFATGMHTAFGNIARLTQATVDRPSPLQKEIAVLSRLIAALPVAIGVLVFAIGYFIGLPAGVSLVFSIGIIVANVPEGLLPTVTLALAMAAAVWPRGGH